MKKRIEKFPVKLCIMGLLSVVCLFFAGIILICEIQMVNGLYDQKMAKRWSKEGDVAQLSIFFAEDVVEEEAYFIGIKQSIDNALKTASIEPRKETARLWVDAYSQNGKVVLTSSRAKVEVKAVGVSGDFFQFHPQTIVSGALLLEENMMKDGIVIDEDIAWQLFGSSQVAGMQVMIGEVPHFIVGVIERPKGRLEEAAGLDRPICYLSLESLKNLGNVTGGFTYEIVLPNPVKGFAFSTMESILGTGKDGIVMVENTSRFETMSLVKIIQNYGIRSMSFDDVVFPYWENIARGKEDVLALLLLIRSMFLVLPGIFIIMSVRYFWKNRTWKMQDGVVWMQDKIYEAGTGRRIRKERKKELAEREKNEKEEIV